jgi:hypothetical protein
MPTVAVIIPSKSEPKCKLCRHPQRNEIDQLLLLRKELTRDPEGKLMYTLPVVLKTLGEWGVENPTEDNIKNHLKRHCEVLADGAAPSATGEEVHRIEQDMLEALDSSDGTLDGDLLSMWQIGKLRLRKRILRGEDVGVTNDHMLKVAAELTKRSHNQSQHELITALTGGIAQAIGQAAQPKQLGPVEFEVIDAEVEDVAA